MRAWRRAAAASTPWFALLSLAATACGPRRPASVVPAADPRDVPALPAPIETHALAKRPPLRLLARSGDPFGAIALVVATGIDPRAAVALSRLVERRLSAQDLPGLVTRSHGLGFGVAISAGNPTAAASRVETLSGVLERAVTDDEAASLAADGELTVALSRTALGPATAAIAACAGEPLLAPSTPRPPLTAAALERWRAAANRTAATALGAVGERPLVDAVRRAVARGRAWPEGGRPADPWPSHDRIGIDADPTGRTLSVALRLGEAASAMAAAAELAATESALTERLAALEPGWSLRRVTATSRLTGACLRLELELPRAAAEPPLETVAQVAQLAIDEAERSLSLPRDPDFVVEQPILSASDPREAALLAAWSAVAAGDTTAARRRVVAYATPDPPRLTATPSAAERSVDAALAEAIDQARRRQGRPRPATRHRVERGQGELWALLATPCGTANEDASSAGYRALSLRALARRHSGAEGVTLEPWITPDGMGLLAHAPRQRTGEDPVAHAVRVGSILGRALASARLEPAFVAAERELLGDELGPGPQPAWWQLLDALAPGHPSWLEPRGTFAVIDGAGALGVATARRALLDEPLRLAVLASWSEEQIPALQAAVARWLPPVAGASQRCPDPPLAAPRALSIERLTEADAHRASFHLGYSLPGALAARRTEAELVRWLLARDGGWLDRALAGMTATARVRLLGGARLGALVISVRTRSDQSDSALAAVESLLSRVRHAPADDEEVAIGLRAFAARLEQGAPEPRRRVVELWRQERTALPTAGSVRQFLAAAFLPERRALVRSQASPPSSP